MRYESPSSVILYNNCPHAYELRYLQHLKPEDKNEEALRMGKSAHKVLQYFYKNIDLNTTEPEINLTNALKNSALENWDRSIDAKKREDLNAAFFLWLRFELKRFENYKKEGIIERFIPVATEEDLKDHINLYRAIIDKRCIGVSGTMYALDYKTDKSLPAQRNFKGKLEEIDFKYKIQAALNAMVLKSQGIKIDNFYFQFIRYPDKLLSVPLTDELFKEAEEKIKEIRTATLFNKNEKHCFNCGLKIYCKNENKSVHCYTGDVI